MKRFILAMALMLGVAFPVLAQDHEGGHGAHDHGAHDHGAHDHGDMHEAAHGHAEGGHGDAHAEGIDWVEFAGTVTNFLLLLVIFVFLGRKPMSEFLKTRRMSVEQGLAESERLRVAAEKKYAEYSERLDRLDEELEKMRSAIIAAGEAERDRLIADAEERAARMRRDAEFLIEQQLKQLRIDLTAEAIEAAITTAGSVLEKQTKPTDQTRLATDYVGRLETLVREEEASA